LTKQKKPSKKTMKKTSTAKVKMKKPTVKAEVTKKPLTKKKEMKTAIIVKKTREKKTKKEKEIKPEVTKTEEKAVTPKEEPKEEPELTYIPPPVKKEEESEDYKRLKKEILRILNGRFISEMVIDKIIKRVEKDKKLEPKLKNIVEKVYKEYKRNRIDPTEACGMVSAQSIGEPGTQMTMRTFHYAGVAEINVTLGLPRLIEIVDARSTPSTPMMNIYLRDEYRVNPELAKGIANKIEITRLMDIADTEMDLTNMIIYVKLNKKTLESKNITPEEVLDCVKTIKKIDAKLENNEVIKITLDEPGYKNLQLTNDTLKGLKIKGIDGIKRVIIRREPNEGYVIYSEGSNFKKVLEIEGVDPYRTTTNDIHAIARELGIEAARNMIIKEAHSTLQEQGLNVDMRHIMLVADVMTADGTVRAIGRHGVSGEKSSVLSRAAFEITVNHLLQASQKGEIDRLQGVAENIIVGQPVSLGTGAIKLVMTPPGRKTPSKK
jgi:DNA-directed RNA polymerase subunit A"